MHGLSDDERGSHVAMVCQLAVATHTIRIYGERFTCAYASDPLLTFTVKREAWWSKKRMVQEAKLEIRRRASHMIEPAAEAVERREVHYESRFILRSAA